MKRFSFLLFFVLLLSNSDVLLAQSALVRGPYLHVGTPSSMVVRWRTDIAEVGKVWFGTQAGSFTQSVSESSATTEHIVTITGLSPDTRYYYRIGTGVATFLSPDDSSYYFQTPIPSGTVQPVRIWAIGDFGTAGQGQIDVMNGYLDDLGNEHTHSWIWLGDNVYDSGTDQEYQNKLFEMYPDILKNTVVYPAPGNHDYLSVSLTSHNGPYYENFSMPEQGEAGGLASGTSKYYSYDIGNVHFVSLTSEWLPWVLTSGGDMQTWLENDLDQNTLPWTIVYWHQPPYTKGTHDSDTPFGLMLSMRQNFNPIVEQYGVDLVLNGHSHNYERSFLINGHYGFSNSFDPQVHLVDGSSGKDGDGTPYIKYTNGPRAGKGTVYAVVGCSAKKGDDLDLDHPVMYYSTDEHLGSMVIEVNDDRLDARFIDSTATVIDEFTILKREDTVTGTPSPLLEQESLLEVFPNPSEGRFTVRYEVPGQSSLNLDIVDIQGRKVAELRDLPMQKGSGEVLIQPAKWGLEKGFYYLRLKSGATFLASKGLILN